MQDFEASDDVVSTNIDTTITPIRMGLLRLGSAPALKTTYGTQCKNRRLPIIPGIKRQQVCPINHGQRHDDAIRQPLLGSRVDSHGQGPSISSWMRQVRFAWLPSTMKAARWRQQSLEIGLWCSRTRLPTCT